MNTNLFKEISELKGKIKESKNKKYEKEKILEKELAHEIAPYEKALENIENKYIEVAKDLAEKHAPFTWSGNKQNPDEIELTEDGFSFGWESRDGCRMKYKTVEWDEIFNELNKGANNE